MPSALEKLTKLVAVLSAASLALGVLFNCFFFLAIGSSWLSLLTLADHLSTASAILPAVVVVIGLMFWFLERAFSNPNSLTQRVTKRLERVRWLPAVQFFFIMWLGILCGWAGNKLFMGLFYTLAALILWLNQGEAVVRGFLGETSKSASLITEVAIASAILFSGFGYVVGTYRASISTPDVEVRSDEGVKFEAVFVGVYDRGSLFIVRPGGQRFFLSQKALVQVQEINRPADPLPVYRKILRWMGVT